MTGLTSRSVCLQGAGHWHTKPVVTLSEKLNAQKMLSSISRYEKPAYLNNSFPLRRPPQGDFFLTAFPY